MKKIIILTSIFLLLFTILNRVETSEKYTEIDGIKYAITVDGHQAPLFPVGQYKADVNCTNANGYFDNRESKVIAKNITGNVTCNTTFNSITSGDFFNNYIINLNNVTQGDGKVVSENGYRYEGKDPNNYVWFNNELWRIIGVFGQESHGIVNTNLVKIIRRTTIPSIGLSDDWVGSKLNTVLNGAYYNATIDDTNCNGVSSPPICDFRLKGIQEKYRDMVENVTWFLGGPASTGYTPDNIYSYERNNDAVYAGRSASASGKIGLMYLSDYYYAVPAENRGQENNYYEHFTNNWLESCNDQTITSVSNNPDASYMTQSGFSTGARLAIRPVLYLKSNVYRVSGSGSLIDPYIIGM